MQDGMTPSNELYSCVCDFMFTAFVFCANPYTYGTIDHCKVISLYMYAQTVGHCIRVAEDVPILQQHF